MTAPGRNGAQATARSQRARRRPETGARIGNGVIVGARAVVGGEIPDYAIVVGNPGRILRLFNRGHLEEARFIALLLLIGVQV